MRGSGCYWGKKKKNHNTGHGKEANVGARNSSLGPDLRRPLDAHVRYRLDNWYIIEIHKAGILGRCSGLRQRIGSYLPPRCYLKSWAG